MIRSFLNAFLPEDEYKRSRILYFMAETTFITIVILLLFGLAKYFLNVPHLDTEFLLLLGPFLMVAYPYFRYIFSGIEHTEVSNKQDYVKKRHMAIMRSLIVAILFFFIYFIVKGVPTHLDETIDLVAIPIIFMIVYFTFEFISLKQSFKKNKDLND